MKLPAWLVSASEESPGVISATRVVMLIGMFTIIYLFAFDCIWHRRLVEIPATVLGLAGLLLGAKVGQAFADK